jgi:hypothetical protein
MVESTIEIGGAVVFWSLSEWTSRERLKEGFEAAGLAAFLPDPRQPAAALRDALEEVLGGPHILVRPLRSRDGFVVVEEDRGEDGNHYHQRLIARVGEDGEPSFTPDDERAARVRGAYGRQRGLLRAARVSGALVGVLESLGGTRLRPGGSVYWLPPHRLGEWQQAARAVEAAGVGRQNAVYVLRHRMDADAVRAVRDAVVAEVQAEATRIHDEVMTGELGGRGLQTRRARAEELRQKINLYEHLLDVGLEALHVAVDRADQAAAAAVLLASAQAHGDDAAVPAREVW